MKFITFLLITLLITNLFAQEQQVASSDTEFKKIQIGVNFSPDYCFRTLQNNNSSITNDFIIDSRNEMEKAKLGYTTGLNVIYNLKKNIGIELGIQFSNKGYQTNEEGLTFGDLIDPRRGFVYTTLLPTKVRFIYNYYYFDIPLKINYIFGKKKVRLITSSGIATNIFIKGTSSSFIEYSDGTSDKYSQQSSDVNSTINLSPFVSFGIDYQLNERNTLRIEPTFRYGVLKINNYPISGYLWNVGLNISYFFGLK